MVVFACNPCPCGQFSGRGRSCECGPVERRNYRKRMSGPILDRIDITRHVEPTGPIDRDPRVASPESSEQVRARVTAARLRQLQRYDGRPWRTNGQAPGALLERHWPMERAAHVLVDAEVYGGRLTRRGATRVHRVAWTLADLRGVDIPTKDDAAVALRLRQGHPLMASTLRRVG